MAGHRQATLGALLLAGAFSMTAAAPAGAQQATTYDVVIAGGRVIDPETHLDAVRNVGISGGSIRAVSASALRGRRTIDARGLIVAPGFIDLHEHGQNATAYRFEVRDGVTSALELEIGVPDIDSWYAERAGKAPVNYGATISHPRVRALVMHDPSTFLPTGDAAHRPSSPEEEKALLTGIEKGLERGALGVGFGLQYTPAASRAEVLDAFRLAALHHAPAFVHLRYMGGKEPTNAITALQEVLADAAVSGAPLHVVHLHSTGLGVTHTLLGMIAGARARGMDVTTEAYPYTAGQTELASAIFDEGWQEVMGISYDSLEWVKTGERLSAESFARYRKENGSIIVHNIPEPAMQEVIAAPWTIVASDGGLAPDSTGHPRATGTYSRVLGRFVREKHLLDWPTAIAKMTLLPARRLEARDPAMKHKGRVQPGADADITVFDPATVADRGKYGNPAVPSAGIRYVLVNGVPVVDGGKLVDGVMPGKPVRAPIEGPGGAPVSER